ncbi:hypothetical protein IDJ75_11210 [Mucilaginibacter rigui]|uniref:Uncharacterized protein n=1 Tax=Mucilaginibacter rigui TaxID=534635 RepID=A0ABR7X5J0_9SPHI|nr:hypothetical protein [Mucilaginibacter rigui]MBD1385849.1 hypothetical protein [Mucilaginibacter rigui]
MKTTAYFIATCFISTFAFFGALGAKNPFPLFAVAFGIWALFLWGYSRRSKKDAAKRFQERLFNDYMRSKTRGSLRR